MAINKVVYNGNTLIDLTDTTAIASDVAVGKYFYGADGVRKTGTAPSTEKYLYQDSSGYIRLSDTMPDRTALTILAVVPRAEISIDALVDSNNNTIVDSDGNQIITVTRT